MEQLIIRELKSAEAEVYKGFFLNGLRGDETKFRISPDDERNAPFPTLNQADSFTLGAYVNNSLAGLVSFEREGASRDKLRHKGLLFRMYVNSDFRGRGIGRLLIQNLLGRVLLLKDIEQINLTVISGNETAKKLYEKFGFKTFSHEECAVKYKNLYFDEEQMALKL